MNEIKKFKKEILELTDVTNKVKNNYYIKHLKLLEFVNYINTLIIDPRNLKLEKINKWGFFLNTYYLWNKSFDYIINNINLKLKRNTISLKANIERRDIFRIARVITIPYIFNNYANIANAAKKEEKTIETLREEANRIIEIIEVQKDTFNLPIVSNIPSNKICAGSPVKIIRERIRE